MPPAATVACRRSRTAPVRQSMPPVPAEAPAFTVTSARARDAGGTGGATGFAAGVPGTISMNAPVLPEASCWSS
ncbi:hypothetical protein ACQEVS_15150 [Streptomyces sp. CA-181903]|uniref:hypothetical protein n=1 Tax=Streptomyces sp. CA-181903 TaxID=3240055 RepID=UPI003D9373F0